MTAKTTAVFEKTSGGCYMTLDGTRLDFDQDVSVQITSGGNVVALNIEGSIYHVQLTASITVNGAAFTGTASELRDKLAGEVFATETVADNDNIRLLKELALRARRDNPRTRPVATEQPTITTSTTTPSGLTNAIRYSQKPTCFALWGGRAKAYATTFVRLPSVTINGSGTGGNVSGGEQQNGARIAAMVDAAKFAIRVTGVNINYRLIVDGYYLSAAGNASADTSGGTNYITYDFTTRKVRHVIIEIEQAQAFDGIHVGATDTVFKPSYTPFRLIAVGDSFTEGTGATLQNDGVARVMGDYLGVPDVWQSGSGGTGYLATVTGTKYTARQRLTADVTSRSPNAVVTFMGINDTDSAALQTEVDLYIRQLRSECPSVPHFVFGVWPGASGPSAAHTNRENYIKAAVEAFDDGLTFFLPIITDANGSWMSGTGKTLATTGLGNSDAYTSTDGTHPNTAGHGYLGLRAADAIINTINSL